MTASVVVAVLLVVVAARGVVDDAARGGGGSTAVGTLADAPAVEPVRCAAIFGAGGQCPE